jgi:hypothetical protein
MFWGVAEDRNPAAATPLRTMTLVAIPLASFRASPAARAGVARTAAPLARCAIHRSAWKRPSQKSIASTAGLLASAATTARGALTHPHEVPAYQPQGPVEG